jgi:hypothetical protein
MNKEVYDELIYIQNSISNMDKTNHLKILQILVNNNTELNENKYGIHVNLSNCPENAIQEIKSFIVDNENQQHMLNNIENIKQNVKDKYFNDILLNK